MNLSQDTESSSPPIQPTLLCVDDDLELLSALQSLFSRAGYRVLVADQVASGLQLLESGTIDLVITDMHLRQMSGPQLLQAARDRWPHTLRFLLAGQADAASIIDAINQGLVSRCVNKPWVDDDLLRVVAEALQQQAQEREKQLVIELAKSRSEELKALNSMLQNNVDASKEELSSANERLKENLVVTLKVFSSLIESRDSRLSGHSRRVAELAHKLATRLRLDAALVREVFFAALLHDVGKLGFGDQLLDTPVSTMSARQLREYREHGARAEQLLMPLQDLRGAAGVVGAQLERFDGSGFPNQLKGRAVLVGARILSVCSDYDNLQLGVLVPRRLSAKEARLALISGSGKRYDPWVLDEFCKMLDEANVDAKAALAPNEILLSADSLSDGMVLARDLVGPTGKMMLSAGHPLDSRLIQKIVQFERSMDGTLEIYIRSGAKAA